MVADMTLQEIVVRYVSIDGWRATRRFKTLRGARAFAQRYVGAHPEIGSCYAVSGDGVGKITAEGCSLRELFPADEGERKPRAQVAAYQIDYNGWIQKNGTDKSAVSWEVRVNHRPVGGAHDTKEAALAWAAARYDDVEVVDGVRIIMGDN